MLRTRRMLPYLVAGITGKRPYSYPVRNIHTIVGVVSGVYIFQPLVTVELEEPSIK